VYLFDPDRNLLTLAESNSRRAVDLAVPVGPENNHVLAAVARLGQVLVAEDLASLCRQRRMNCPVQIRRARSRAGLIAPLIAAGQLYGVIQLNKHRRGRNTEVGLPLDAIFRFLARCLQHAQQHRLARTEARVDRLTGLFNYRWMTEGRARAASS